MRPLNPESFQVSVDDMSEYKTQPARRSTGEVSYPLIIMIIILTFLMFVGGYFIVRSTRRNTVKKSY